MKKRYMLLLIAVAAILAGCQKDVTEKIGVSPTTTVTAVQTPAVGVDERYAIGFNESFEEELKEIEQLLQELESLDSVQLDV